LSVRVGPKRKHLPRARRRRAVSIRRRDVNHERVSKRSED
jgi:hypothetical protein